MNQYLALYRKYRPATFAELVGQEAVARTLASAIKQGRLGHAYLFCGPRGTGKTSVARILAKSVNCAEGPTDFPCGTCANCREITNGNNLDVIEIDAASNNGVDNIRDLQDRVALAPVSGRYKVYIIDEVHMLSQGAFNALLKTLEEPPPNVLFILATTDPHKVLPTIISRCQRFDFGRIALGPLVGRLRHVAEAEGFSVEDAGLEAIARRANGGLRDALSLLDQIAAMADGQAVTAAEVASSLGLLSGESVCALGGALLDGDVSSAIGVATEILAAGYDHGTVLRELMAHFRHLMLLQLAPERAEALDVPTAQLETLKAQSRQATGAELPWILETLNETEGTVRRSPQQAIWLELGLIKVATRPAIPSFQALVDRVAALEAAIANGDASAIAAPTRPAARPVPVPQAPARPAPAPVAAPVEVEEAPRRPERMPAAPGHAVSAAPAEPVVERPVAAAPAIPAPTPTPTPAAAPSETGRAAPPGGPSFKAPEPKPAAPAPQPVVEEAPAAPAPVAGGLKPLPNGAWDRVRMEVKARSVPTAALLEQQAAIDRWEADGAVVIRIGKAFKDTFERAGQRKKVLHEAIVAVFGAGAFARLESGDAKAIAEAGRARPTASAPAAPAAPAYTPSTAPAPAPAPAVPAARPVTPPPADDDYPMPEAPPDWLDELEDSRPDPTGGAATGARSAPAPSAAPERSPEPRRKASPAPEAAVGPTSDDQAVKLAVELFNGRVVAAAEES